LFEDTDSDEESGELLTKKDVRNRFNAIVENEKQFQQMNLDDLTSSRKKYDCSEFDHLKKSRRKLGPLVVLYMFSGIGSGIVALKRLGVAIKKVICVDDDLVASHVNKHNHDCTYHKQAPPDHIEYIDTYTTYNQLKKNLKNVLLQHGPIDLILGGSASAHEGRNITSFRELVSGIKNHCLQKNRPVFFLSESNLAAYKKLNVKTIRRAYGKTHPPTQVNSGQYSPCEKIRTYWLNLPFDKCDSGDSMKGRFSTPNLDDGFCLPELCLGKEPPPFPKAKSFEALNQVDSDRMMKLKIEDVGKGKRKMYKMDTFSVAERERMMGFDKGYVENAVEDLYENLKKSFNCELEEGKRWYGDLDKKYFHFSRCKFNFVPVKDFERQLYEIEIRLPTTTTTAATSGNNKKQSSPHQQGIYCDKDKYAKHLLGNAYSIAVAEVLLSPLKEICTLRRYEGYDYDFSWIEEGSDDYDDD